MIFVADSIMMQNAQAQLMSELNKFEVNPAQYLIAAGLNIPPEKLQNPKDAVEYIIATNQGTVEQLNQFKTMLSMFHK